MLWRVLQGTVCTRIKSRFQIFHHDKCQLLGIQRRTNGTLYLPTGINHKDGATMRQAHGTGFNIDPSCTSQYRDISLTTGQAKEPRMKWHQEVPHFIRPIRRIYAHQYDASSGSHCWRLLNFAPGLSQNSHPCRADIGTGGKAEENEGPAPGSIGEAKRPPILITKCNRRQSRPGPTLDMRGVWGLLRQCVAQVAHYQQVNKKASSQQCHNQQEKRTVPRCDGCFLVHDWHANPQPEHKPSERQ